MNQSPLVSVIMPCYNAEKMLEQAVNSITNQTYSSLEIICINDGSKDKTGEILDNLAKKDNRIKVVHNPVNLKLIGTLNKGIELAQGAYIARMDADDISLPQRIERQIKVFKENPDVDVVGCAVEIINNESRRLGRITDFDCTSHLACQFVSLFSPPVSHPAAMIKANLLKHYKYLENSGLIHVEDYELWSRMILDNRKFHNIQEPLFLYRLNTQGVSISNREGQNKNHLPISNKLLKYIVDIEVADNLLSIIERLSDPNSSEELTDSLAAFKKIKTAYIQKFREQLSDRDLKEINSWYRQRVIFMIFFSLKKGNFSIKIQAALQVLKRLDVIFYKRTINNLIVRSNILLYR